MDGEASIRGWRGDGPMARLALSVAAGIAGAAAWSIAWAWLAMGVVAAGVMLRAVQHGRGVAAGRWGLLAVAGLAGAWSIAHSAPADLERYLDAGSGSRLVAVTGRIASPPRLSDPGRGAMGRFSYQQPVTLADLDVQSIVIDGTVVPTAGRVRLRLQQADDRLSRGMTLRTVGWLQRVTGPANPGEIDFRPIMRRQGIVGWLTVRSRDGWQQLEAPSTWQPLAALGGLRQRVAETAAASLRRGLEGDPAALALCETMLLGVRVQEQAEQVDAFRRVGLAHLLSISGAHLGILMGIVLLAAKGVTDKPPRVWAIVLAVLGLYLLAVPWRVPILRAAVMVGLFALARLSGRQARATEVLALAAILLLLWRPIDLFDPGFQLSFGVVLALVLYAEPVALWLWPRPELAVRGYTLVELAARAVVDYFAVSLVAFAVALPLVAYHFQLITPLAVVTGVLALPVVAAMLGVGYLKIVLGTVLPSGGVVLSGPLGWLATGLIELVERAASWPGAALTLPRPPSVVWIGAALVLIWAMLEGKFGGRRVALGASVALVLGWGAWDLRPGAHAWASAPDAAGAEAVVLTMLSVGDGSCFIVQLPDDRVWMFDCGSQAYLDVGEATIAPALRAMGIDRIDTLVLSHADIDHYAAAPDLAATVPIGRVLMPPHLLAEAAQQRRTADDNPDAMGPTAFLLDALQRHRIPIHTVIRGWGETHGPATLDVLWPTADTDLPRANDQSIVLRVRVGDRQLLLTGDIQQDAITALLATEDDLQAQVIDLAHHGSFVDASPDWLAATIPQIALQSSGPARLYRDPWPAVLGPMGVQRYVTARHGAVQVTLDPSGPPLVRTFCPAPGADAPR